eukprot:355651-Prorocentrum_minimum.AAC.7
MAASLPAPALSVSNMLPPDYYYADPTTLTYQRSRYIGILAEMHKLFEYALLTQNTHAFESNLISASSLLERFCLCVNMSSSNETDIDRGLFFDEPLPLPQLLPPLTPTESQASSTPSEEEPPKDVEVAKAPKEPKRKFEPKQEKPTDDVNRERRIVEKARVRNTFKGVYMPKKHTESSQYEARMVHPITKRKHTKRFGTAEDAARYYNLCMIDMYRAANMAVPDQLLNKF